MRIAVLMKQVPATDEPRHIDAKTLRIDRSGSLEADEIGERALELALLAKDRDRTIEVVAVSLGPATAKDVVKKALTMGADRGIYITDARLVGTDAMATAEVLAETLRELEADLIICGTESTDGRGGVVPSAIAERLGHAAVLGGEEIALGADHLTALVPAGAGRARVRADYPTVLAVSELNPDPRFPTFKGIISAKRRPLDHVAAAASGAAAATNVRESRPVPVRSAGRIISDDGSAAAQLAEFLWELGLTKKGD